MTQQIIVNLAAIFLLIIVPAVYQANLFKQGKTINHTKWALVLSGIMGIIQVVWILIGKSDLSLAAGWLSFFWGMRFLTFDYTLNILRGYPLDHLGEKSEIDKVLKRVGKRFNIPFIRVSVGLLSLFILLSVSTDFWSKYYPNVEHNTALTVLILISISIIFAAISYFKKK